MPLYVYQNHHGTQVEAIRSVADRDVPPIPGYKRVTVPQRIGLVTGLEDPENATRAVPQALKDLEQTVPAREIARQAGFSVEHLKRTWAI